MKYRTTQNQLRRLRSRIPPPTTNLRHISTPDIQALEGHILAAVERQRRAGKSRLVPAWVRDMIELPDQPLRSLPARQIRRILRHPEGANPLTVQMLKKIELEMLNLMPMRQVRTPRPCQKAATAAPLRRKH